jgi:N-acetylmuramate 1-kinase
LTPVTTATHDELRAEAEALWPELATCQWQPLTPDGSDRTYHRLRKNGDARILMVYRGQNATSVEGFLEVHRLFEAAGLPVARLEAEAPEAGLFLLEDLGDVTLEAAVPELQPEEVEHLYEAAIGLVVRIQAMRPPPGGERPRCFELAFDQAKLEQEMDFFFRHMAGDFLGLDLESPAAAAARSELHALCRDLGSSFPVLAHRDYHCRNLMVHEGRLRLIDYQDARMGRRSYDLVSLLYDSYIDLPDVLRERMLALYEREAAAPPPPQWRGELMPMAVQRSVKALGSFGYFLGKKGKAHFADSVARTLGLLAQNLPAAGLPAVESFVLGPLAEACQQRGLAAGAP